MGRSQLHYKDVFKHDLKLLNISIATWDTVTANRSTWKQKVQWGLAKVKEELTHQAAERRQIRHTSVIFTDLSALKIKIMDNISKYFH